jgi:hypothetical protein
VFQAFLNDQLRQGLRLAEESDLLEFLPLDDNRFVAHFLCTGLIRDRNGEIQEHSDFHVGIWLPSNYLRNVDPAQILTWLYPPNVWHPNIFPPAMCARFSPGTDITSLLYVCYEMITYVTWAAHDPLNPEAARWARRHQDRFPVDRRPLKRRRRQSNSAQEGVEA